MPIYVYECGECGNSLERVLPLGSPTPVCEKCGERMNQGVTNPAYIYMRGEGGYPSRRRQIFNTTKRNHPKLDCKREVS